ncbi:MAG: hypothetical protein HYS05_08430 [Acidobacteria bacterium]|nr:hypothetical protein [Acidobacteriota bacterium]
MYRKRQWGPIEPVSGLYVHPVTGIVRFEPEPLRRYRGRLFVRAQSALRDFGVSANAADAVRRYRIDGLRLWEHREAGWFIHTYHDVPEQLIRLITRSDSHEVPIYSPARRLRLATKQASKKEIRDALPLLQEDPLATARRFKP